jgi:hypothetical protein
VSRRCWCSHITLACLSHKKKEKKEKETLARLQLIAASFR